MWPLKWLKDSEEMKGNLVGDGVNRRKSLELWRTKLKAPHVFFDPEAHGIMRKLISRSLKEERRDSHLRWAAGPEPVRLRSAQAAVVYQVLRAP